MSFTRVLSSPLRRASATFGTKLMEPLPRDNPIWSSKAYRQLNPHLNAPHNDVVTKDIPLDRIRPELLENQDKLTLELCRGVWSNVLGFDLGRTYYYLRHYGPSTSHHLWTRQQLSTSNYEPGTELTNHFNVLERTPSEILIRFADAPAKNGLRPLDGLFAIGTQIDRDAGVARLSFTTLIFKGDEKMDGKPLPAPVEVVHWGVSRFWMVLASRRLLQ